MALPQVDHLRFARQKWLTGLEGLSAEDALKRLGHSNSISWMVGHLACFEQFCWLEMPAGRRVSEAVMVCDFGLPASTPDFEEMLAAWHAIMDASNPFLDGLTEADLLTHLSWPDGRQYGDNIGTMLHRHTWHYWYHTGEVQGIRQALGHENLPQFVGRMAEEGRYK